MPRVNHTPQLLSGSYPANAQMDTLTFLAADPANDEQFSITGQEIIIARNTGASTRNVIITAVADRFKRTTNVTKAIAAGAFAMFGPVELEGWMQSDGKLYFEADNAEVTFAVIKLPR
jgi:hypothetical protein